MRSGQNFATFFLAVIFWCAVVAGAGPSTPKSIAIPGGEAGFGFDDLQYSASLRRVLVSAGASPKPEHVAFIPVPGGPESLAIDKTRGRGYSNLWTGTTVAIDLKSRAISERWSNGCEGSRGLALDEQGGRLFVGCAEGRA